MDSGSLRSYHIIVAWPGVADVILASAASLRSLRFLAHETQRALGYPNAPVKKLNVVGERNLKNHLYSEASSAMSSEFIWSSLRAFALFCVRVRRSFNSLATPYDMDATSEPTEPRRVQELWFEDGNIVIQAGKSQYRVYRAFLAARSSVFQDMFAFPQPSIRSSFFKPFPALTEFDTIVGCLRLGHKYEVDYLRRRALIHLSSNYHTTLSDYDLVRYHCDPDSSLPPSEISLWDYQSDGSSWIYIIAAIQLAREVDAPWILPHAFYELGYAHTYVNAICNGVAVNLTAEDQESFAKGYIRQNTSTTADILRFLFHPLQIEGCTSRRKCFSERLGAMERIREKLRDPSNPLGVWEEYEWKSLENLCSACLTVLKKTHADSRLAFWDKLPDTYGLSGWKELEKLKVAAIGTNLPC
ncbi:hypothetical protein B0H19DRAFT_1232965 [Mycena capillaripes]|nr:hypothetical protein B0H19DRAFT_1232965 [Mycena capillaripes]